MLILFIYITRLASNEKFKFSSKLLIWSICIIIFIIIILKIDPIIINIITKTSNRLEIFNNINLLKNENLNTLNILYNKPNYIITIIIINYLLITLIAVVKITKFNHGPLRQIF